MTFQSRPRIARSAVTGLILAGGQGSRMGGVDKGLEPLQGRPLIEHAIARLAPQVGTILISANRNADRYAQYGFPVVGDAGKLALPSTPAPGRPHAKSDTVVGHPPQEAPSHPAAPEPPHASGAPDSSEPSLSPFNGPLAGIAAGLATIETEWMLVVPCDAPLFPEDLASRLIEAIEISTADIAVAATIEPDGTPLKHPVFALIPRRLGSSAAAELALESRKLGAWYARHSAVQVSFRDSRAFYNANTLHDLRELER